MFICCCFFINFCTGVFEGDWNILYTFPQGIFHDLHMQSHSAPPANFLTIGSLSNHAATVRTTRSIKLIYISLTCKNLAIIKISFVRPLA